MFIQPMFSEGLLRARHTPFYSGAASVNKSCSWQAYVPGVGRTRHINKIFSIVISALKEISRMMGWGLLQIGLHESLGGSTFELSHE